MTRQGFRNAELILGDGRVLPRADLVIGSDGKIEAVGPYLPTEASIGTVQWQDCEGSTIMPALVNPHGHIGYLRGGICDRANFTEANVIDHLRRLAYYGVGTFQSLGTDRDDIEVRISAAQRAGRYGDGLTRLLSASTGFVAITPGDTNGGPGFATDTVQEVADPVQARAVARSVLAKNPNVLKVWVDSRGDTKAVLDEPCLRSIVQEAHAAGTKVIAHIYDVDNAKSAIRAGVDGLAHMVQTPGGPDAELLAMLAERDVFVFSSISIHRTFLDDPAWMDEPWVRATVSPQASRQAIDGFNDWPQHWMDMTTDSYDVLLAEVGQLRQAGVRVVFSCDTGLWLQFIGVAEHRELEAMVACGFSAGDAIAAATGAAAEVVGMPDRGLLEAGRRADLIVLDASPLTDIRNTRRIRDVYLGGRRIDRSQVQNQLSAG